MQVEIKATAPFDTATAYALTRELMEYHNALDIFTMTPERFSELVESGALMSFIAYADGEPIGIMNSFYKYTTFTGQKIFYIEDLYVRESLRGTGIGGRFIEIAEQTAKDSDCGQIELKCAVWNEKSAGFYKSHGFETETDWNVYTLNIRH